MPVWLIVLAAGLYVAGLFAVAWRGDRHARGTDAAPNPFVYALALSVYCTSWTYFGAVGTAASSGWDYLPIYAGPVIVFVFLPGILKRIGEVAHRESISSLADFLSARYGKSRGVGALAALAAVMGSLPYIALQLKSVGMSFQALAYGAENAGGQPASETVLLTALAMAVFAILFGARQSDATRRNSGLMHVLALEAVIKLVALVAVSLMSMTVIMADPAAIPKAAYEPFTHLEIDTRLITMTLLSMCAIICLPRQFHVTVIERKTDAERHFARFVFPLYLILTSAVVIPITVAGIATIKEGVPPDLYVMDLPLASGDGLLAMLVFLGGFSAATGMVIVACVALSTMVTNDLIVPAVMQTGRFASLGGDSGARLTTIRRSVIVVLVLLAYGYYRLAGTGEALAQIGLLSFAAAAQFAPSLIGAVYWRGGRRAGVLAGLAIGMVVWAYTLFLPAILSHDRMAAALPGWLDPYALFGMRFEDSLTHGALWSLGANLAAYVLVSLRARERLRDKVQAGAFVGGTDLPLQVESGSGASVSSVTPNGLKTLAARFLTPEAVDHAFADFENRFGLGFRAWRHHRHRCGSGNGGLQRWRLARHLLASGPAAAPVGDQRGFLDIGDRGRRGRKRLLFECRRERRFELGLVAAIGGPQRIRLRRGRAGPGRREPAVAIDILIEDVAPLAHVDLGRQLGDLEIVVAFLEVLPEGEIRIVPVARHVLRRHAERKRLDLERFLTAAERVAREGVDLLDLLVGHRIAARRRTGAMHHQIGAGPAVHAVIGVRKADIERQMIARLRVHLRRADVVEALRRLAVAFGELRPELARPFADVVAGRQRVASVALLLPDFQNALFLEDAQHDRRAHRHVLGLHGIDELGRELALCLGRNVLERLVAAGERDGRDQKCCAC